MEDGAAVAVETDGHRDGVSLRLEKPVQRLGFGLRQGRRTLVIRTIWENDSIVLAADAITAALLVNVETNGEVAIQIDSVFFVTST